MYRYFFCSFLLLTQILSADIFSINGKINLDVNDDGNPEASLNHQGLGIGKKNPAAKLDIAGHATISDSLAIGTQNKSSTLHVNGSLSQNFITSTGNLDLTDHSFAFISPNSSDVVVTLPYAGNVEGRFVSLKVTNTDYPVTVSAESSYIDRDAFIVLNPESTNELPHSSLIASSGNWYLLSSSQNTSAVAQSNLLYYFRLDETSGNLIKNIQSEELVGVINKTADHLTSPGVVSHAFDFTNEYIDLGVPNDRPDGDFTLAFWIYRQDDGDKDSLIQDFDWNSGSPYGYSCSFANNNNLAFRVGDGTADDSITVLASHFPFGTWMHISIVYDYSTGDASVYKNGVSLPLNTSGTKPGLTFNSNSDMIIGNTSAGLNLSDKLDEIRLYNKKLSESEINQLYHAGLSLIN